MAFSNLVTFGTVTGNVVQALGDSNDPDSHPDSLAAVGSVVFTPNIGTITVPGATTPVVIALAPVTISLDGTGAFSTELIATDNTNASPIGWTWNVSFKLVGAAVPSFDMHVATGTTTDISSVVPVAPSSGTSSTDIQTVAQGFAWRYAIVMG